MYSQVCFLAALSIKVHKPKWDTGIRATKELVLSRLLNLESLLSIWSLTIVGSLKILPAIISDYMETLFSDRAIVGDRE